MKIKRKRKRKNIEKIKKRLILSCEVVILSSLLGYLSSQIVINNERKRAQEIMQKQQVEKLEREEKIVFDTNASFYSIGQPKEEEFLKDNKIYEFTPNWQLVTLYRIPVGDVRNNKIYTSGQWCNIGNYLTKNIKVPFEDMNTIEKEGKRYPKFVYGNEVLMDDIYEKIVEKIQEQENTKNYSHFYMLANETIPINEEELNDLQLYTYERKNSAQEWANDGNLYLSFKTIKNYETEETRFHYLGYIEMNAILEERIRGK